MVYKIVTPRKWSLYDIWSSYQWDKPCWETFQSRFGRRWGRIYWMSPQLLEECMKPPRPRRKKERLLFSTPLKVYKDGDFTKQVGEIRDREYFTK